MPYRKTWTFYSQMYQWRMAYKLEDFKIQSEYLPEIKKYNTQKPLKPFWSEKEGKEKEQMNGGMLTYKN